MPEGGHDGLSRVAAVDSLAVAAVVGVAAFALTTAVLARGWRLKP
jgi:hypothetical protein